MALEHLSETHNPFWFEEATRRARLGMQLLDERGPADWRARVNVLALDMGHALRDVLGQLYGSYHRGMCALFGEDWWTRDTATDPQTGNSYSAFGFEPVLAISRFMLTDAWRKELWSTR
jgi:hypothetical protein